MEARHATQQCGARELRRTFPSGDGEGGVRVCAPGGVSSVIVPKGVEHGTAHRGLLGERCPLPVDTEALTAEGALKVLPLVGLSE